MPNMNEQHIARLEAQLERLVESTFAHLFGKRIRAQDIALQLARAMEQNAVSDPRGDSRAIAPDHYAILMPSVTRQQLLQNQPALSKACLIQASKAASTSATALSQTL